MSSADPETTKQAIQQVAGPRYRPAAYPLLELAKTAVHGHAMIAEKVREHAEAVAQEHAAAAAARAAEKSAAAPPPAAGG